MRKALLLFFFLPLTLLAQNNSAVADTAKRKAKEVIKDEVIVSATRASENSPTTFQTISKEELNKNNLGQDLPFLLDMTPSVVTTSDAGTGIGYTGLRIRGTDATGVNVTLNGIPVNDAESQGVYWVDMPDVVSSSQNIQIQRGVGTSTNGPGAFGGSLSMQTQSPSVDPFGEINLSGGSFQTIKANVKAGTGLIKGRYFVEGSFSYITSQGYIDRAFANLHSYFLQAGYIYKNTLIKALYFGGREKTYQAWDGVLQDSLKTNRTYNDLGTDGGQHSPPYANQTDNYGQDYFQLLLAQQLPKNLYLNLGLFTTLGRGYYEEYKVGQDYNSYFPGYDTVPLYTDLIRQKWLKNSYYGGTFSLNYEHHDFSATVGGLLSQYLGENFGKVIWAQNVPDVDPNKYYYDGHSTKNDFDVYAKFNYELFHRLDIYADLQYRYVSYKTNGTDDNLSPYNVNDVWNFFNPKVGVLYKIKPAHQVYASFAIANREPNHDDILAAAVNNQPKPELLRDVEVGYKGHFKMSSKATALLNLDYYLMDYKDQLVLTGELNDVGNPIKANVPSSYRTGAELSGGFNFYHEGGTVEARTTRKIFAINYTLTLSMNKIKAFDEFVPTYDANYNQIDSLTLTIHHKNTDISFSPDIIASLELAVYPIKGLSISMMNKYVGRQFLDNTSDESRMLNAFYYSNINISYTVPLNKTGKEITFKVLFNNIFNRLYESNGYTYSERYLNGDNVTQGISPVATYNYFNPQAGFNALAGVSVRF